MSEIMLLNTPTNLTFNPDDRKIKNDMLLIRNFYNTYNRVPLCQELLENEDLPKPSTLYYHFKSGSLYEIYKCIFSDLPVIETKNNKKLDFRAMGNLSLQNKMELESKSIKKFYELNNRYPTFKELASDQNLPNPHTLCFHFKCTGIYDVYSIIFNIPSTNSQIESALDKLSKDKNMFFVNSSDIAKITCINTRAIGRIISKTNCIGNYKIIWRGNNNRGSVYQIEKIGDKID
jgi:hypothetical protein